MECQLLKMHGQVHGRQGNACRYADSDRRKIEDALNTRLYQQVSGPLGSVGRYTQNPDCYALLNDHGPDRFPGEYFETRRNPDAHPDFTGIMIKNGDDIEAFSDETAVTDQRLAEIARPYHQRLPGTVRTQDSSDPVDHLLSPISDARMAKLTKTSKVFAHLGIRPAEWQSELLAVNVLPAFCLKPSKLG